MMLSPVGMTSFMTVLVPLLSQFSISKLEHSSFKFLGLHIKQTDDISVHIRQDTKSIKSLPPGCRFFEGRGETGCFEVSGRSTTVPRPDMTFLISDLARSSSKTLDERLRVARALLRKVRELAKSIVYCNTGKSTIDLRCYPDASYNQATNSGIKFNVRGSISGLMTRSPLLIGKHRK